MTFIANLWFLLTKPQIIVIVKAIIDIIGSTQMQKLLESIKGTLKEEAPIVPPVTEPERERLVKRLFQRLALRNNEPKEKEST
jgi:translation initiation factor 2 gamma subunit (eIF-2gamma)